MSELWSYLLAANFVPQGSSMHWDPHLVQMFVCANILFALACFSIPAVLLVFVHKSGKDLPYPWVFTLFSAFILASGYTHYCAW